METVKRVTATTEVATASGHVIPTMEDLRTLIFGQAALRADVVALTNRHIWVEQALEETRARLSGAEALRGDVARLAEAAAGVAKSVSRLQDMAVSLRDGLARSDVRTQALAEQQATLQNAADDTERRIGLSEGAVGALQGACGELANALTLFVGSTDEGVFILKRGDLISDMASRSGKWDPHVLKAADLAARTRRGTAVDAGAHFGLVSVPLARRFNRVISFEPNGFNVSLLRANAALNGLGNIESHNAPLFSRPARLSLAPGEEQEVPMPLTSDGGLDIRTTLNLGAYRFHLGNAGLYAGDARALDSFEIADLAFLKVDTQGADGEVLMGAMDTIGRCRPWVVFEWEKHLSAAFSISFAEVTARFAALDYDVRVLWRHNEKQIDYLAIPAGEAAADMAGAEEG
jgi:FkbM family methyltransferase